MQRQEVSEEVQGSHVFSTRDMVVIAMLSALGGVLSAYVGYLGNLVNRMLGVPFGAGQFMAGLHVLWMVLAHGILMKRGAASATGVLKGMVEMFMGSVHGVVIVVVSAVQGVIYDAGMVAGGRKHSLYKSYLSAGLSAGSNVLVFAALYLRAVPLPYILVMFFMAFSSGVIFAGYFGNSTLDELAVLGMADTESRKRRGVSRRNKFIAVAFVALIAAGSAYYFSSVYQFPGDEPACAITGEVESEFIYTPSDFSKMEVTITAELQGAYTYVGPRNYTGVPLWRIVSHAKPLSDTKSVTVVANDGYSAVLLIDDILENDTVILIQEGESLRLVADGYEGAYWVRNVSRVEVS